MRLDLQVLSLGCRCRANVAHAGQPRPGLGVRVKARKTVLRVPSSLGSGLPVALREGLFASEPVRIPGQHSCVMLLKA